MSLKKHWLRYLLSFALVITITIPAMPFSTYAAPAVEKKETGRG